MSGLESYPSAGWNVESTTGYTFTPGVGSFTSLGIDTSSAAGLRVYRCSANSTVL